MKGEVLKGEVLKGKPRQMLTRPGRLRAQSGSKLPEANVPLRALKEGVQKIRCLVLSSGALLKGFQTNKKKTIGISVSIFQKI